MEKNRLYFLHLPKTAGSTLTDLLDAQYHQQTICPAILRKDLNQYTTSQLARFLLFRGHLDYGIDSIVQQPIQTITVLRNPLERLISFYNHACTPEWKNTEWNHFHRLARSNAGFKEFALHQDIRIQLETCNGQARRLCAPIEDTIGWSDERLYSVAKVHLDSFILVGITEELDKTYKTLCRIMGWKPASVYSIKNIGRKRTDDAELPSAVRKSIMANNAVDWELFKHAQESFNRRYTSAMTYIGKHTVKRAQRIVYHFDQPLPGDGWHGREHHPKYGWFRWMGPRNISTLEFIIPLKKVLEVTITIVAGFQQKQAESLQILVENTPLKLVRTIEGELMRLHGNIPANLVSTSRLILEFVVPACIRAGIHDDRMIGAAVQCVIIEPCVNKEWSMPNERVIEIPWALAQLPQSGIVLDVGSCETTYLHNIPMPDRILHCMDIRPCELSLPSNTVFHAQDLLGNDLPPHSYDAVLILSTLEHIGLPHYGSSSVPAGDHLALAEARNLLKPHGKLIVTVPVGRSRITSWYRQYSPDDLHRLFRGWMTEIVYWGFIQGRYQSVNEDQVTTFDYDYSHGAGAVAGIVARIQT